MEKNMPARCPPRPENEVACSRENNFLVWAAWCSACRALRQETTAWSRSFPTSYSCSLLFQHASVSGLYRWGFDPQPNTHFLYSLCLLLSDSCQMVSINKRLFKQRNLLNTTGSEGKLDRLNDYSKSSMKEKYLWRQSRPEPLYSPDQD